MYSQVNKVQLHGLVLYFVDLRYVANRFLLSKISLKHPFVCTNQALFLNDICRFPAKFLEN